MSIYSVKEQLEIGIEGLNVAIEQIHSLKRDSLTEEWLRQLWDRKKVLVGKLQLLALERTDQLVNLVNGEDNESRSGTHK